MWIDGHLKPKILAHPLQRIAQEAGMNILEDCKFIMVEENKIGAEKLLSRVLSVRIVLGATYEIKGSSILLEPFLFFL